MKKQCEMLYTTSHHEEPHLQCKNEAVAKVIGGKFDKLLLCSVHADEGKRFGHNIIKS